MARAISRQHNALSRGSRRTPRSDETHLIQELDSAAVDGVVEVSREESSHPTQHTARRPRGAPRPSIWILQEVANSQAAIVCCGGQFVSARVFAVAPFLLGLTPELRCQAVLDIMPGIFRKESWFNGKRDLPRLSVTLVTARRRIPGIWYMLFSAFPRTLLIAYSQITS